MYQYFSYPLSLEFTNVMLCLLMRQLESYNTQLQAKLNYLKYQIPFKEIVIRKKPFHSRKHSILKMINLNKLKIRLWIKPHNSDKKNYKLNNQLMQSLENLYQSSPNSLKLRYPILSSLVLQALHYMINQKVFPMLEMLPGKELIKPQKVKKAKLYQEIKQIVILNLQIYWNLIVIPQNLHLIHAI